MIRSVLAVVAGFVLIGLLSLGADLALRAAKPDLFSSTGRVESTPVLLLMLVYTFVFTVVGSYVTARLAPRHPLKHALVLGGIGLVLSLIATVSLWGTSPLWHHIASLAIIIPAAWLGGRLVEARRG